MYDSRRHFRIKEHIPVQWRIRPDDAQGQGTIRNISTSGALLETEGSFRPPAVEECEFELRNLSAEIGELPQRAKLIWFNKFTQPSVRFLCGLEFVNPSDSFTTVIKKHVDEYKSRIAEAASANILNNYV